MHAAALAYLARYASSTAHLRQILLRRLRRRAADDHATMAAGEPLIPGVLDRLTQAGLLDDREHAAMRVASLRRRGASARAIINGLAREGIHRGVSEAAMAGSTTADELVAAIAYARRRRLGPFRPVGARAAKRLSDLRALGRAGFDYDVARVVVDAGDPEALATLGADG
ncbi:MAG: regulatory protein RecX [Alphaproteobacteria bacterium]|nr:regulatory protein RecX [Alphaproteobacteria bacterium]